jgi:hypothetical protein
MEGQGRQWRAAVADVASRNVVGILSLCMGLLASSYEWEQNMTGINSSGSYVKSVCQSPHFPKTNVTLTKATIFTVEILTDYVIVYSISCSAEAVRKLCTGTRMHCIVGSAMKQHK